MRDSARGNVEGRFSMLPPIELNPGFWLECGLVGRDHPIHPAMVGFSTGRKNR
jgi:hypothetical protein